MAATALIKFTQNLTVGDPGHALKGVTGVAVDVQNSSNTDVASWQIDLLYTDPASAVISSTPYAFNNNSNTPLANFTPDVRGSYRWMLKVWNVANRVGNPTDVDIRVFNVPQANGLVVPPTQIWPLPLPDPASGEPTAKPNEMNFEGQLDGWAGNGDDDGGLNDLIRRFDPIPGQVTTLITDVNNVESAVAGLVADVDALQTDVDALQDDVGELNVQVVKYPGVLGAFTTNLTTPLSVGCIVIDPTKFPSRTITFEVVLFTKDASATANVRLYNLTDGEFVTGTQLTSTSLTLERKVSATLTVGASAGNLKNSLKVYEVQLSRSGGTSDHFVDVHLAQLSITI